MGKLSIKMKHLYPSMGKAEKQVVDFCQNLSLQRAKNVAFFIITKGNTAAIVYGRLPLMTLEKCVIREIADCATCQSEAVQLRDRRGVSFPVLREWKHRNVIYNSLPTCMSDRADALDRAGLSARHFIFSVESAEDSLVSVCWLD